MHVVVVSSPGAGSSPHWSHQVAADFAALARAHQVYVHWLAAIHRDQTLPPAPAGCQRATTLVRTGAVAAIAGSLRDMPLEQALTGILRQEPGAAVVHFGVGARGTPNVLWLGERLGSRTFAWLRGAELVCARGDLVDRDGEPCTVADDPDRCRWCCSTSWWRRPRADDIRNRTDLLLAGLLTAEAVFVPDQVDADRVVGEGLPAARVVIGGDLEGLLGRVAVPPG